MLLPEARCEDNDTDADADDDDDGGDGVCGSSVRLDSQSAAPTRLRIVVTVEREREGMKGGQEGSPFPFEGCARSCAREGDRRKPQGDLDADTELKHIFSFFFFYYF